MYAHLFLQFTLRESAAASLRKELVDSMLPWVGASSCMKLYKPIRIVPTDHTGFQVSGWKSDIERQRRVDTLTEAKGYNKH